jgi:hypothetical protein
LYLKIRVSAVFDFFRLVVNRNAILVGAMLLAAGAASAQEQTIAGSLSVGELAAGQSTNLTVSYTYNCNSGARVTPALRQLSG